MRVQTMMVGMLQAALLTACQPSPSADRSTVGRVERPGNTDGGIKSGADAISLGSVGEQEVAASPPSSGEGWLRRHVLDPDTRLILRTGQAGIEVDSLEPAMAEVRRIARLAGGFVADASVRSGRHQLRQATLELKVPSARFDELTEGLQPVGRVEFVNVAAEDVSEEFVDLSARIANGRRLEDRLVELLRTRTGKLADVLSVERELARVREEIERMEGRLRFLRAGAELSTLSVSLHEPVPIVAAHGQGPLVEAFRDAWRNFVGVLAGAIASLGFAVPVVVVGWGLVAGARRYGRRAARA